MQHNFIDQHKEKSINGTNLNLDSPEPTKENLEICWPGESKGNAEGGVSVSLERKILKGVGRETAIRSVLITEMGAEHD